MDERLNFGSQRPTLFLELSAAAATPKSGRRLSLEGFGDVEILSENPPGLPWLATRKKMDAVHNSPSLRFIY